MVLTCQHAHHSHGAARPGQSERCWLMPLQVPQPIARDGGAAVAVPVPATSAAPAPTAAPGSDTPAGSTAQVPAAPFSSALASNTTRASLSATDLVNLTLHEAVPPVAPASAAPATGPAPDAASKAAGSAEAPALIAADAGAAAPAADAAAALVTNAAAVSATPERWVPPSDGHDAAGLAPLPSSTGLPPVRSIGDLTAFTAASGGGAGSGVDPGSLPPVKVETTRRHNAAAEGSSSAGYSASATSSQQQGAGGSSIVQGGAGSSIVQGAGGSSAAQGGAGSSSQGPTLGSSAAGPAGSSVAGETAGISTNASAAVAPSLTRPDWNGWRERYLMSPRLSVYSKPYCGIAGKGLVTEGGALRCSSYIVRPVTRPAMPCCSPQTCLGHEHGEPGSACTRFQSLAAKPHLHHPA